jgi:hypothetical protein
MVRALLAGKKTQTRRVLRWPKGGLADDGRPDPWCDPHACEQSPTGFSYCAQIAHEVGNCRHVGHLTPPYGKPGDRLWVREAYRPRYFDDGRHAYRADWSSRVADVVPEPKWKPGIHMPRAASRILLEVTEVRVEQVQEISEADAVAEGTCMRHEGRAHSIRGVPFGQSIVLQSAGECFAAVWDEINGKRGFGWAANPWVYAISVRRVSA